jgi:hypothetical protein
LEEFHFSLDKTLLHNDIDGIPDPSPLKFAGLRTVIDLDIDDIVDLYERVADRYQDREDSNDAMLKASKFRGYGSADLDDHLPARDQFPNED